MLIRSSSQRSYAADIQDLPVAPGGLWRSGSRYSRDETADSSDAGITSNLDETTSDSLQDEFAVWDGGSLQIDTVASDKKSDSHLLPVRSVSQRGLWGGDSSAFNRRDKSPGKRRWTAVERSP